MKILIATDAWTPQVNGVVTTLTSLVSELSKNHEVKVIEQFLPEAISEDEIESEVKKVIDQTGAEGMKDMGKVMGIVTKKLMGKADGKTISTIVRNNLN